MFEIVEVEDIFDTRLTHFRKQVLIENGQLEFLLENELCLEELKLYLKKKELRWSEDAWKFSLTKWRSLKLRNIQCVLYQKKIISISGCNIYSDKAMRVAMNHYTLKEHRKTHPFLLFLEDGLFHAHLTDVSNLSLELNCLFISIFPHNNRLMAAADIIQRKKTKIYGYNLPYISSLTMLPRPMLFHGVPQLFFVHKLNKNYEMTSAPKTINLPNKYYC